MAHNNKITAPADAGQTTSSPEVKPASLAKLQNQSARPDILTDELLAAELFVKPRTIRSFRMNRGLPFIRVTSKIVRIRRVDAEKWLARHAVSITRGQA